MEAVKKMVLLPADYASKLQNTPDPLQPVVPVQASPIAMQLSRLDSEMKKIVDDTSVPDDVKFKLYNHVLHQHGKLKSEAERPHEIQLKKVKEKLTAPSAHTLIARAGEIPDTKRDAAMKLAAFLEQSDELAWTDKGELLLDGMPVEGSNIHDLFDFTARNRTMEAPPIGFRRFYDKLYASHVPLSAIGNRNLKARNQQGQGVAKRGTVKKKRVTQKRFQWNFLYK